MLGSPLLGLFLAAFRQNYYTRISELWDIVYSLRFILDKLEILALNFTLGTFRKSNLRIFNSVITDFGCFETIVQSFILK
jgi:hypothetical protein